MATPSPPDREFRYTHIWEITDEDLPVSSLEAEASRELGPMLGRLGVRPTRRPRFEVCEDRLVAIVPVLRLDGDAPADPEEAEVVRLLVEAKPVGHIAAQLGVPRSAVEAIRARLGVA